MSVDRHNRWANVSFTIIHRISSVYLFIRSPQMLPLTLVWKPSLLIYFDWLFFFSLSLNFNRDINLKSHLFTSSWNVLQHLLSFDRAFVAQLSSLSLCLSFSCLWSVSECLLQATSLSLNFLNFFSSYLLFIIIFVFLVSAHLISLVSSCCKEKCLSAHRNTYYVHYCSFYSLHWLRVSINLKVISFLHALFVIQ